MKKEWGSTSLDKNQAIPGRVDPSKVRGSEGGGVLLFPHSTAGIEDLSQEENEPEEEAPGQESHVGSRQE